MDLTSEIANRVRKLNIYLIPQYLWLILLYYLTLNALYKIYDDGDDPFKNNSDSTIDFPNEILLFNETIMTTIEKWTPFLWFLAIALIFSGLLITFIKFLPVISSYKISDHCDIGIYLGFWVLLIAITIYLFNFLGYFFPLTIPICFLLTGLWQSKLKNLI
ncbi:hypothetical protein MKZ19_07435 [Shouchella clausii]|uniref:hypothetical protein n=1 Tax=Shouchella clausii TaxID=79880 RepID=UPI0031FD48AB